MSVSVGARYTTTLVHDSIVEPVDAGLEVAPALALTIAAPPRKGWAPQLGVDVSSSDLVRHDAGGATTSLQRVTTLAFSVGVSHMLLTGLRGSASIGGLKYLPSEETGVFREGAGGIAALGAVCVAYGVRRWALEARYDVHAFSTPALRQEGFSSSQTVHRVTLGLAFAVAR